MHRQFDIGIGDLVIKPIVHPPVFECGLQFLPKIHLYIFRVRDSSGQKEVGRAGANQGHFLQAHEVGFVDRDGVRDSLGTQRKIALVGDLVVYLVCGFCNLADRTRRQIG